MKRVTYKTINERKNNQYGDLPKLKDILVDLSVRNTPKVVRSLRLIGNPIEFYEYNNKKRVPGEKNKTVQIPFPDADKNNKITRIGADDRTQCPWYEMGYIGSKKYAIRCLEKQEDGTWVPKILCKGPSVFDEFATWELGRHDDLAEDPNITIFLGGDKAPIVKVQAVADDTKLGGVDYKVFFGPKDMALTEELINLLRAVREPSADELNSLRSEYNSDREEDDSMAEWRDYFEYSFDLKRIFKFTPPVGEDNSSETAVAAETASAATADATEAVDEAEVTAVSQEIEDINW